MKPESPLRRALRLVREELLCAIIEYDDQGEKDRAKEALRSVDLVESELERLRAELREEIREGQRSAREAYAEGVWSAREDW